MTQQLDHNPSQLLEAYGLKKLKLQNQQTREEFQDTLVQFAVMNEFTIIAHTNFIYDLTDISSLQYQFYLISL